MEIFKCFFYPGTDRIQEHGNTRWNISNVFFTQLLTGYKNMDKNGNVSNVFYPGTDRIQEYGNTRWNISNVFFTQELTRYTNMKIHDRIFQMFFLPRN